MQETFGFPALLYFRRTIFDFGYASKNTFLNRKETSEIRNFPISTWVGLGAIFLMVFALGIFSYSKLNRILEEVSGAARPDLRLLAVKGIQSDMQDAENSVKTFSLTRDTSDLRRFSEIANGIEGKLNLLLINEARNDEGDYFLLRLDSLVYEKFEIQRSILELTDGSLSDQTLEKLRSSLNHAARTALHRPVVQTPSSELETSSSASDNSETSGNLEKTPETELSESKKPGWIRRLFSRKEKSDPVTETDLTPIGPPPNPENTVPIDIDESETEGPGAGATSEKDGNPEPIPAIEKLSAELEAIREKERARARALTAEELKLTREDQRISTQIREVVMAIEVHERRKIASRTTEAESLTREANQLIVLSCITLTLLLLILTFGIFSYFRTTSQHRKGIEKARNAAVQLAKARESFLATMSHEIRTPMNAIIGFTERVLKSKLKKEQATQLNYVKSSANHLLEIVNDVLDFSKLEAGAMTFMAAPFSLKETLETCLNAVRLMADSKGIILRMESDSQLPETLNGDAKRLRQVLMNLLTNAARFTDSGEIVLQARLKSKLKNKIAIEFAVVDTGIGITEADQKAVFEEFTQADLESGRNSGGTGLGLSICRRIVELQGGKIWLESIPAKGTRVAFHLQFSLEKSPLESPVPIVVRDVKKVLVVDDTEYNRLLLNEVLTSGGLEVVLANNGLEALKLLAEDRFDLVLLDIRMPKMDGIAVLKQIRGGKSKAPSDQQVIALTAAATAEDRAECRAAGCDAILGKPFKEAELWKMIGVTPKKHVDPERQVKEEDKVFSLAHLKSMAHGNTDFVVDMVQSYLVMADRSQIQIESYLKSGQYPEIGKVLHKLAPATRHLEANEASQLIKRLEGIIAEWRQKEDSVAIGSKSEQIAEQYRKLKAEMTQVVAGLKTELEELEKETSV
jgi:signal transduction histidine kinase/FixJ family two-component response regulator